MKCWYSFVRLFSTVLLVLVLGSQCRAFVLGSNFNGPRKEIPRNIPHQHPIKKNDPKSTKLFMAVNNNKATLTEETTWRLRFSLTGVPTRLGRKVGELFSVNVQFREEQGFEPPQGTVVQVTSVENTNANTTSTSISNANINALKIKGGRWKLSEDPNDRKDGLWVWGLFSEPLYPFMLLNIETEEYVLTDTTTTATAAARGTVAPSTSSTQRRTDTKNTSDSSAVAPSFENDSILPLKIYAQINHKRDRKTGQVTLEPATLTIRKMETVKADILGAASVEIYDEIQVGQLSLRPLTFKADALL